MYEITYEIMRSTLVFKPKALKHPTVLIAQFTYIIIKAFFFASYQLDLYIQIYRNHASSLSDVHF